MRPKFYTRVTWRDGSQTRNIGGTKHDQIGNAQYEASKGGVTAEIVRVDSAGERVVMRYWRDSEGLQYLEY